jgi:hypothetical protein
MELRTPGIAVERIVKSFTTTTAGKLNGGSLLRFRKAKYIG